MILPLPSEIPGTDCLFAGAITSSKGVIVDWELGNVSFNREHISSISSVGSMWEWDSKIPYRLHF